MVRIHMEAESERLLRHHAQVLGQPLEAYLSRILEAGGGFFVPDASQAMFEQALDDLTVEAPFASLPTDFSRAAIYGDHD